MNPHPEPAAWDLIRAGNSYWVTGELAIYGSLGSERDKSCTRVSEMPARMQEHRGGRKEKRMSPGGEGEELGP